MNERPLARELLPPGLEDRAAAPLVAAVGGDPDLARAAWAFAHGMIMLELNERFPPGVDLDAWQAGLRGFARGDNPVSLASGGLRSGPGFEAGGDFAVAGHRDEMDALKGAAGA